MNKEQTVGADRPPQINRYLRKFGKLLEKEFTIRSVFLFKTIPSIRVPYALLIIRRNVGSRHLVKKVLISKDFLEPEVCHYELLEYIVISCHDRVLLAG